MPTLNPKPGALGTEWLSQARQGLRTRPRHPLLPRLGRQMQAPSMLSLINFRATQPGSAVVLYSGAVGYVEVCSFNGTQRRPWHTRADPSRSVQSNQSVWILLLQYECAGP